MENSHQDMTIDDIRDTLTIVRASVRVADFRLQTILLYNTEDDFEQCRKSYYKAIEALDRAIAGLTAARNNVKSTQERTGRI